VLHHLVHLHFLAAGCLFTWAIAGPDPAPHRSSFALRLGVLFVNVATHGYLSKLMYAYRWPRGTHHALAEIQDAAQWMYYGGDVAEALLAVALFSGWYQTRARRHGQPTAAVPGSY
ncbi:MAG: cytochrome c oxidase assembly protein, partial [Tunicatimonas sp.]